MTELADFPRCSRCGIYLIRGMVSGTQIEEWKARFGWKFLHLDQGVRREEADAVVVSCGGRQCPRCKRKVEAWNSAKN